VGRVFFVFVTRYTLNNGMLPVQERCAQFNEYGKGQRKSWQTPLFQKKRRKMVWAGGLVLYPLFVVAVEQGGAGAQNTQGEALRRRGRKNVNQPENPSICTNHKVIEQGHRLPTSGKKEKRTTLFNQDASKCRRLHFPAYGRGE